MFIKNKSQASITFKDGEHTKCLSALGSIEVEDEKTRLSLLKSYKFLEEIKETKKEVKPKVEKEKPLEVKEEKAPTKKKATKKSSKKKK